MAPAEAARQATRLSAIFAGHYEWPHDHVTRELITAIENHYEKTDRLPATAANLISAATAPAATDPARRRAYEPGRVQRRQPHARNETERT
jgi:hypothetical protein